MNETNHPCGMFGIADCTRRCVLRLGASLLLNSGVTRLSALGRSSALRQTLGTVSADFSSWHYREYAVHATIMLGALPLCWKRDVGGAAIAFEHAVQNQSALTGLQFVAGSWPDRLRGFNRFGAVQEIVREEQETVTQSGYAGFMPSSPEKHLADARNSFASPAAGAQMFTVAFGRATAKGCTFLTQHRFLGPNLCWTNCAAVLDGIDDSVALPPEVRIANYGPGCLPTFLFAVRRAYMNGVDGLTTYVHSGKVYRLRSKSKIDQASENRVLTGWASTVDERGAAEFKFWVSPDDVTALPVKIEFRARSFLKLTLEAEPSTREPALQPLLKKRGFAG